MTRFTVRTIGSCPGCPVRCGDTVVGSFADYEQALAVAMRTAEVEDVFTQVVDNGEDVVWQSHQGMI